MGKLRIQLSLDKSKLEQFDQDLEELRKNQDNLSACHLTCSVAYPGASLTIGSASYRFRQETRPVAAKLLDEDICII